MTLYNEIDPYAAQWIRNLVAGGHVAPGDVEERSIRDLTPDDVRSHLQAHFFAGIGVWSHALRSAGWPDARPVWTGSCPCQPFSSAGRAKGFSDDRHLWPDWFKLIAQCRPPVVLGEQVASPDGLRWLDLVRADLEGAGYAFGASDLCAAGVGAPHIRQRLYFVAVADRERREGLGLQLRERGPLAPVPEARGGGEAGGMADTDGGFPGDGGVQRSGRHDEQSQDAPAGLGTGSDIRRTGAGGLGDPQGRGAPAVQQQAGGQLPSPQSSGEGSDGSGDLADAERDGLEGREHTDAWEGATNRGRRLTDSGTSGFWSPAEWLPCQDGRLRPVEPGTFPLAHGVANRVGKLRAYGNAICGPVATTFVRAVMQVLES
jgi:DNA (cytosine-5)-methyltransferase 1